MAPCNCGKTKSGATIVYQLIVGGQDVQTYSTQTEAQNARAQAGGKGTIIRTTQPAR